MTLSSGQRLNALLIEDNPADARLIREMLRDASGMPVRLVAEASLADGLAQAEQGDFDVLLLDLSLPDSHGLETFTRAQIAAPHLPIVVLSGLADETVALDAVHRGAQDYLVKGQVDGHVLIRAMRYAVERKRLDDERAELIARERAAQHELERQKDEFFANVSHDLRTPLFAIKVSIGVVLANEPPDTPEPLHRLFTNIDAAADEMARLVDDLLELTRLQAGRVQLRLAECDLTELATRVSHSIEPLAAESDQRLTLAVPPKPVVVQADAARLERVLANLLGNAAKYGRRGGLITLALERLDGGALLSVADDGPGIPPSEHERIFERYYRVANEETRRKPGSGLGLPIARRMVELHGGRLWVESRPGQGATFKVALPAVPAAEGGLGAG